MKTEDRLKQLGGIDPKYIASAEKLPNKKRRNYGWIIAAAAVIAVLIGVGFALKAVMNAKTPRVRDAVNTIEPMTVTPTDNTAPYYIPHDDTELPTVTPTDEPHPYLTLDPNATHAPASERAIRLSAAASAPAAVPQVPASYLAADYNPYIKRLWENNFGAGRGLGSFYQRTVREFLLSGKKNENTAYSPLNVYMALAMLAETASGETRRQILDLLGSNSIEALRTQADSLFLTNYHDNDLVVSKPSASLWLNSPFVPRLNDQTLRILAEKYHASSYEGDMDDPAYSALFRDWMNEHTGDLLEDQVEDMELTPIELMRLVTAIYYKVGWENEFFAENNTEETFHSPDGDETVTFMHGGGEAYAEGEGWQLTFKSLSEGRVWFILPDEGVSLESVIADGSALELILAGNDDLLDFGAIVHLNTPKIDVESQLNLEEGLMHLGVTDCFDETKADFSPLTDVDGVCVTDVTHGVRVLMDEEGVSAAAYTMILYAGSAEPTHEVDFSIDRPFMFVITGYDNTPLFAGTVYHPAQ